MFHKQPQNTHKKDVFTEGLVCAWLGSEKTSARPTIASKSSLSLPGALGLQPSTGTKELVSIMSAATGLEGSAFSTFSPKASH